ncbi:MAG: hypothetical protein HQL96_16660 [Magnetococcales bacterium]|nr:hypothetical protein [Magnetococcales bacterium]
MNENKANMEAEWIDPDDAPELTDAFFEEADEYIGDRLIRRGRPSNTSKKSASARRGDVEGAAAFPV